MTISTTALGGMVGRSSRRWEHRFYLGMAIVAVLVIFAGFARTYYLRRWFATESLRPLLHLHGLIFTGWIVFLVSQSALIGSGRVRLHRRLGVAGGVLAVCMVLIGVATAITRAREGMTIPGGPPPLVFMAIPLADLVVFGTLVGAGIASRRRAATHKRLMLLATLSLLTPAIARLPLAMMQAGPPAFFGLTDLFLVPLVIFDLATLRRIHPATLWGTLFIVLSQPLRLMVSGTESWLAFATWLTGG
jgi:hypothetical protein